MKSVDICLVTTGHPSTNPRLVKELNCLLKRGYQVHVVACKFIRWADLSDAEFAQLPCEWTWVPFGEMSAPWDRTRKRVQHFLSRAIAERLDVDRCPISLVHSALHPAARALCRAARRIPAKLYIAHNLAALPAAYAAAQRHHGSLGFDAEDFHRGQFRDGSTKSLEQRLVERLEDFYMPKCEVLTAGSDGIAGAYEDILHVKPITTILNVFVRRDRDLVLPATELEKERPAGQRSLYWFSQTIGGGRGLESVLRTLPNLPSDVVLSLRGTWGSGYRDAFMNLATQLGVANRVRELAPCPPGELVRRTACHDIGLALETGFSTNNDIAVSNKLFTYLTAGIPCVLTPTRGQRPFGQRLPQATRLAAIDDLPSMQQAVSSLLADYEVARESAERAGVEFCWEKESDKFLSLYQPILQKARVAKSASNAK